MERKNYLNKYIKYFLYIIFAVGIAGHIIPSTRNLMLSLTPLTLFITSIVVIISLLKEKSTQLFYWLIIFYVITFIIEVVGVKTGLIFGDYIYGSVLGFKIMEVPLIIGINWVLVILGAIGIASSVTKNKNLIPVFAGVIAVVFDLILEPVAVKYNYWTWAGISVPLQNYAAWFIIAFFAAFVFVRLKISFKTKIPQHYLLIQTVFFGAVLIFG